MSVLTIQDISRRQKIARHGYKYVRGLWLAYFLCSCYNLCGGALEAFFRNLLGAKTSLEVAHCRVPVDVIQSTSLFGATSSQATYSLILKAPRVKPSCSSPFLLSLL